jgi:hypothetical protein
MSTPLEIKKKANDRELPLADTILFISDDRISYKRNEAQKITTILGMKNRSVLYGDAPITEVEFAQV